MFPTISRPGYPDFEPTRLGDARAIVRVEDDLASCGHQDGRGPDGERTSCDQPTAKVLVYQTADGFGGLTFGLYLAPRCRRHLKAARERIAADGIKAIELDGRLA